jgi:hypothetical protein
MTEKNSNELAVGTRMQDGSIYAGISPETNKKMYVTAKTYSDYTLRMTFNGAQKCASTLDAHGHRDWHVPTIAELKLLYRNREKGALKDVFNKGSHGVDWYWSSTSEDIYYACGKKFSDDYPGSQGSFVKGDASSVCFVRSDSPGITGN